MNWLDIVLIVMAVVSIIAGLKTGLVRALLGLAAMICGLICGLWFYSSVGAQLTEFVHSRQTANVVGFFLIFVGIVLLGALLSRLLERLLKLVHLSWLDRLLGGAFGALRAVLVAAVIVLAIMAFAPKPGPESVTQSRLAPYVVDAARTAAAAAPYEVKEGFRRSYEKVKEIWAKGLKGNARHLPSQEI